MIRVFVRPGPVRTGDHVKLSSDESHYLVRVRRTSPGTAIEVLDGESSSWAATVIRADAREAVVCIRTRLEPARPAKQVTLLLGVPDTKATAQSLAHATELGARAAILFRAGRSQAEPLAPHRIDHVVRAAQRQCGRPDRLVVTRHDDLASALKETASLPGCIALEHHRSLPSSSIPSENAVRVLVGPEGGFEDEERQAAEAAGLLPLSLGPWILRTETAVIAAITRLLWA